MILFENCKGIGNGSLFKSKYETKEEVLNKSKSLVNIFFNLYFLVFLITRSISLMFTKNLSKSFDV